MLKMFEQHQVHRKRQNQECACRVNRHTPVNPKKRLTMKGGQMYGARAIWNNFALFLL